jgi:hypothetical protein
MAVSPDMPGVGPRSALLAEVDRPVYTNGREEARLLTNEVMVENLGCHARRE